MIPSPIQRQAQRGVSLPEVAIAMVVLAILVLTGTAAFTAAQKQLWDVSKMKHARDIALARSEILIEMGRAEALNSEFSSPYSDVRDGTEYIVSYNVTASGVTGVDGYTGDPFWQVVITVSYNDQAYSLNCMIGA